MSTIILSIETSLAVIRGTGLRQRSDRLVIVERLNETRREGMRRAPLCHCSRPPLPYHRLSVPPPPLCLSSPFLPQVLNCPPHHISGIRAKPTNMSTRSGAEFRAGASAPVLPEEMPQWKKSILRSQEESKVQIEFLMAQILELKTAKPTETFPLATTFLADSPPAHANEDQKVESQWDATKRGAKLEVTAFDGSLDPKKYMDWEVGLDEYFDWYQLPESRRRIQFAQMKLTGQARIYWRNLQATTERRHDSMIMSWVEMKSRL